jgi:hypothetical protein
MFFTGSLQEAGETFGWFLYLLVVLIALALILG